MKIQITTTDEEMRLHVEGKKTRSMAIRFSKPATQELTPAVAVTIVREMMNWLTNQAEKDDAFGDPQFPR